MDQRVVAVGLALLLGTFAGCAGEDEADGGGDDAAGKHPASDEGRLEIPLPNWTVGDWWTFVGDAGEEYPYVLVEEGSNDWTMATSNPEFAFADARSDVSFLGAIRKSDLAGSQGSDRVKYFDFPLADGKNWTTVWDGVPLTMKTFEEDGVFGFEGRREDGKLYTKYEWDADAAWFRYVDWYDENETRVFGGKLTSNGHDFSDEVVSWDLEMVIDDSWTEPVAQPTNSFSIDDPVTDLWLSYDIVCASESGGYNIVIGPTNVAPDQGQKLSEQTHTMGNQCGSETYFEGVLQEDPVPGTWNALLNWGNADGIAATFTLLKRTLVSAPFPG